MIESKATAKEMWCFIRRQGLEKKFESWVRSYRTQEDLRKLNENIDASEKAFNEYLELMEKTNSETDPKKKSDLRWKTMEAWSRHQELEKEYKRLQARVDKNLGLK